MLFFLTACQAPQQAEVRLSGSTMGTSWSLTIVQVPEGLRVEKINSDVEQLLEEINASMSTYQADSEISRFNQFAETVPFPVSQALFDVLSLAKTIHTASKGAFDPTIGPLVNLWGFGPSLKEDAEPEANAIANALQRCGFDKLHLQLDSRSVLKSDPDVYLDLSAIAKGYAVDQIAEYLQAQGVKNYLVEIGGEIRVAGKNSQGHYWQIGVEKPDVGSRSVQRVVTLRNQAIATSGDYRNFFQINGKVYSHTINPKTGYPVAHQLASVSVLSHTAVEADAQATAIMVLGPEAGFDYALENNLSVLFIIRTADGFKEKISQGFG